MQTPLNDRRVDALAEVFLEDVYAIPGGEKVKECIQCGTCSASCPTSYAMDYTPREIIASLRAGSLDRVLRSNTIWLCASCYSCTVRCPSGIKLTDIMYELKRLAIEFKILPRKAKAPIVSKLFVSIVDKYGRISETELVGKFMMKTNPLSTLKMIPRATKLFLRGRLPLIPNRIEGTHDLRKSTEELAQGLHPGTSSKEV